MPGFDRTGPNGEGPKTGRGMGDCQTQGVVDRPMRGGMGFAGGRGFGGLGMRLRMRNRFLAQNSSAADNATPEEIAELYNQVETLSEQVAEITSRLGKAEPEKEQKNR